MHSPLTPLLGTLAITVMTIADAAHGQDKILPEVPEGAQAVTLSGTALFSSPPSKNALENLDKARSDYETQSDDADSIIWLGRRLAYTGDYRAAIRVFSEGIAKHPDDARMYRHRGHRYITIREFRRAIADLEKAAALIEGTENETEPDGLPNALNKPISSLHGNIWYHLGLAYYLVQDWENALRAYDNGFGVGRNDDNRVSTTHWRFSILRRMGESQKAEDVLVPIRADMEIIENMSYHRLCLFYKGELSLDELMGDAEDSPAGAAVAYGVANWMATGGDPARGAQMLDALTATEGWAGFGFIAAEADLAAR